jgi:hypothetical protein
MRVGRPMAGARARMLAASGPIHLHPSLWWCPRAVLNPSVSQPSNPQTLMGRRGVFSLYPFLPVGAFGPFSPRCGPRGSGPGVACAHLPMGWGDATWRTRSLRWLWESRRRFTFCPLPITRALSPSTVAALIPSFCLLHLPAIGA